MPSPTTDNPAWTDDDLSENPHENADKASRVRRMFSAIAPSYDLNNRLHSMWRDQAWRRAAVKMAGLRAGESVVDVACGTGDLTLAFAKALDVVEVKGPLDSTVTGIDFTYEMLPIARRKAAGIDAVNHTGQMDSKMCFVQGDAIYLPKSYRYRHIIGEAGLVVAVCSVPSKEAGDM